jgi:hypothetical protein
LLSMLASNGFRLISGGDERGSGDSDIREKVEISTITIIIIFHNQ